MVGIRVDPHIWQLAGELGIKRYEVCEEALQKAIKKLGAVKRLKK